MLVDELNEDRLTQLLAFIDRLQQTPARKRRAADRTKLFGECKRVAGETTIGYYGKLRQWLDRDMPQPKSRRRARQSDDSAASRAKAKLTVQSRLLWPRGESLPPRARPSRARRQSAARTTSGRSKSDTRQPSSSCRCN